MRAGAPPRSTGRRAVDAPPPSVPLGLAVGGKYVLRAELGSGAMGVVYEAVGPDGAEVALKTILRKDASDEIRARFEREASALAQIAHPNVLPLLDHGFDESVGAPYYVMPRVRGLDLGKLLARIGGPLAPATAVSLVVQAARGVAAGHAVGIVHRDLKPSNLMLAEEGDGYVVKVSDFGLAKNLQPAKADSLTASGALLGSPHYMPPEQSENAKRVDERADVYALGMVLYAALAGAPAFTRAGSFLAFVVGAAQVPPLQKAAPWIDPAVARAVHAALLRSPAARWPSMSELELGLAMAMGWEVANAPLTRDRLVGVSDALRAHEAEPAEPVRHWEDLLRR